jgi:hypothetical protein
VSEFLLPATKDRPLVCSLVKLFGSSVNIYSRLQKFVRVLRKGGARFVLTVVYAVERAPQPATPRPD